MINQTLTEIDVYFDSVEFLHCSLNVKCFKIWTNITLQCKLDENAKDASHQLGSPTETKTFLN